MRGPLPRYQVGRQTLVHGDCLVELRAMPAASVDVIPTSSPYNQGVEYHSYNDRRPRDLFLDGLGAVFAECHRVLKPEGSFFLNVNGSGTKDDPTLPRDIVSRALAAGFTLQNEIIWAKAVVIDGVPMGQYRPLPGARYLNRVHEVIVHLTKTGKVALQRKAIGAAFADASNIDRYHHAENLKCGGDVWFMPYVTVQSKAGKFEHPAGFPVELPLRCIKLHGATRIARGSPWVVPPSLTVLDPFCGTGTTLVAAQQLGCTGIGIEIDPQYVETARQRLAAEPTPAVPDIAAAVPPCKVPHPTIVKTAKVLPTGPIEGLLRQASAAGAQFGLLGAQVRVTGAERLAPELRDALRVRRDEIWTHLGGAACDAAPIVTLHQLGVELLIPTNVPDALEALAQVERDSDEYSPEGLPRLLGLDIETAALPGIETRPPTKLKRNGEPAKSQPAFKGTAALDPHRSRIRLVQLYSGGTHAVVLDLNRIPLDLVAPMFERRTVIVHNASFELRFLGAAGVTIHSYEDSMQGAGLLLGVRQRSLEDAAGAYLGVALTKHLQTSDWSAPQLSPGQYAYAAIDAIVAFRLWPKLHAELIQKGREVTYQLQRDVTRVAVAMTDRGITLDRGCHQQQIEQWRLDLAASTRAFQQATGQLPPSKPAETVEYLKKVLPEDVLATWPTTPKNGAMSTKASDLRRHVVAVPAIRDLLEIRATQTLLNNFGDELLNKISARTGRLHPGLHIASAKSGRSSSSNPNIQQIPKNKSPALRAAFVAAAGYRFIIADYSMMELRAGAEVSNDAVMRGDFADGVDLHRQRAAAMLGIPEAEVSGAQRDSAKPINFGTIYGAGPVGLAASAWNGYGILLTPEQTGAGRQDFLSRYYTFAWWMREHHARCTETGRIDIGCYGRVIEAAWEAPKQGNGRVYRRNDDDDDDDDGYGDDDDGYGDEWPAEGWATESLKYTLCCNAPVQGACADAGMLALLLFDAALKQEGIDGGPVLFVHDEIVAEVATDQAARAAELLKLAMEQAFTAVFPEAPVNGLVEIAIRKTWGKTS